MLRLVADEKRDDLLARVSDVLRRSGIDDAEELIRRLELNLPPVLAMKADVRTDGVYQSEHMFATDATARLAAGFTVRAVRCNAVGRARIASIL